MQKVIDVQIKTKDDKNHVRILGMKDIDPKSIVIHANEAEKKQQAKKSDKKEETKPAEKKTEKKDSKPAKTKK